MVSFWVYSSIIALAWVVLAIMAIPGLLTGDSISINDSDMTIDTRRTTNDPLGTPPAAERRSPRVSVLLAARNEARCVRQTIESLRAQTWLNLEVIVVNDRSTDDTGHILNDVAKTWQDLQVIHVTELPHGWLGKNHALYTASKLATGDWLLFTDADIEFHPRAIEATMQYLLDSETGKTSSAAGQIDHLTLSPKITTHGFWLSSAVYLFLFNVVMVFRPQNADRKNSSAFVGIGAFNLIRRQVYDAIGGHKSVALRPDEDLAIGAVIKKSNFHQKFVGGTELLTVEWYPSLREMAHGLEKNSLAPFEYQLWKFTLGVLMFLLVYCGPAVGCLFSGYPRYLCLASLLIELFMFRLTRRYSGVSSWWGLSLPLAAPVLFYILVRSAVLCVIRGGIHWRGTFYKLKDLRNGSQRA